MNNTKTTKRALLTSVVAIFMCVTMLIGTTFAWFTDTASTAVNKIQAGTLDVALEMKQGDEWVNAEGQTLSWKKAAGAPDGEQVLWEPGCTYQLQPIRIKNNGDLALKYRIKINGILGNAELNKAIVWKNGETDELLNDYVGTLMPGQTSDAIVIIGHMKEDAGNEYQGLSIDGIGITVNATQLASEFDSFDDQYDGGANYEGDYMATSSAVVTAPMEGETLNIVLNNNAPASQENSTSLTMEIPAEFAGKEVKFSATTYNASATQNDPNFSIATGNNIEVAALKLDLTVGGQSANGMGGARTVTTYIQIGLTGVNVTYVGTGDQPTDVQYDPATGKLSFTTTHFSDYVVTAQALTEVDGVYEIHNANDLFAFARLVNVNGNSFSGKTVKLMADIDLAGKTWTPVGQTGATQFQGTFDGKGYTISNMTVNNPSESENVSSGFFGWLENTTGVVVNNVKFENANVTGSHYVGVVSGYLSGTVTDCVVNNSTVNGVNMNDDANGDKIGGIVGFINAGTLSGNKVTNCSIIGNRDIGGIVGAIVAGSTISSNTVSYTNIAYETVRDYASAGEIVSGRTGFVPDSTNTANNVTIIRQISVSTAAKLASALSARYTSTTIIKLDADIDMSSTGNWEPIHVLSNLVLDGNNHTISNMSSISEGGYAGLIAWAASNIAVKDLIIDQATVQANGTEGGWLQAAGVVIGRLQMGNDITLVEFDNVKITNSTVNGTYAAGFVGYNEYFTDVCTPEGDTAADHVISVKNCSVTGSTFNGNDATGALIGLNNTVTNISDTTVTGNTINGGNGYSAAALVGTSISGTTAKDVTASGNTFGITNTTGYQVNDATYGYVYKNGKTYSVNGTELN